MFIKRLEIFGFKSFKDKTILEFESQDITGVVGPNGCGKSNIVDALLWVMGENSPKNLRGEALSDIIFGGTSKESSGNLAEVKLTLNPGRSGFPAGYNKFSEIIITRRSYREGGAVCFINERECLLREVREFFMNTGAGCRGFSIIEQESIERLITAKPLQRRYIIEEAAGITKFKNQKAESIRKLNLVDQNLKRLDDILKIQTGRLSHLSSQAKKAEKYKKLKKEIELRDKEIKGAQYQSLVEDQKQIRLEVEKKERQKEEDAKALSLKKDQTLAEDEALQANEKELERIRRELSEKRIESAGLKDKAKTFEMIEELEKKIYQAQREKKEIQEKLIKKKESFKSGYGLSDVQTEILKAQAKLDELKQNKNSLQVHIDLLTKQMDFVKKEKNSLSAEEENFMEAVKQSLHRKNQIKDEMKKEKARRMTAENGLQALAEREKDLKLSKEQSEAEISRMTAQVSALSHKLEELKKLSAQFSKMNKPAEELLQWKPEQFHLLFKKLETQPGYAKALSAVLGPVEQALAPDELIDLEQGIERLKESQKGKSWFLSPLPQDPTPSDLRERLRAFPAFICFLDDKVQWNVFNSPLKPLLQKTAVVSNLKSGFELKKEFPGFQFVTKSGDFITQSAMVYAGSDNQESGWIEIQAQVEEGAGQLSAIKTKLKAKRIEWDNCLRQFEESQALRKSQEEKLAKSLDSFKSLEKELEFLDKDLVRLSEIRDKNKLKIRGFEGQQNNLQERTAVFSVDVGRQDDVISSKLSYLKLLNSALAKIKTEKALEKEQSLLLNVVNQSRSSKKALSSSGLKEELEKNKKEKARLESELEAFQKEREKAYQKKTQIENERKALESGLFQAELDIKSLVGEEEKKEIEKAHLKEKFKESYNEGIEDFKADVGLSLEKLKEELPRFQEQLERIKEVNFLALEEYDKLFEDNQFLTKQKEELQSSQKGITKVIHHIDKTCKSRFNNMLEETNKRFSRVFPIIFGGDNAKAELILHEEKGEQGVDIKVHPPGKRPQSISLLSRGEKALTSICLIYALFLVKTSPFCIIDEADAPLDDANIFRFLSVLKEMSRKSQMIVITHNKYTMKNCDKLYGVTQKEPGISQIVSVDMNRPLPATP